MSNPYDSVLADDNERRANGAVASVNGVSPSNAATGLNDGPTAGLPPEVAMRAPDTAAAQAAVQRQRMAVASSPDLAAWASRAPPAHVAAASDSFPQLAGVFKSAQDFINSPVRDILDPSKPSVAGDVLAPWGPLQQQIQAISGGKTDLFDLPKLLWNIFGGATGSFFNPILAPVGRGIAATGVPVYGRGSLTPITNPQERAQAFAGIVGSGFPGLGAPEGGPGSFFEPSTPVPPEGAPPNAPRLTGPPGAVPPRGPSPEVAAEYAPSPYTSVNLPPQGVDAASDTLRTELAKTDAQSVTALQDTIAKTPVFTRNPEVVEAALQSRFPSATATVDPDHLINLAAEGHTPFPDQLAVALRAAAEGSDVTVPLSRYLAATAGQPYAADLNSTTTFREGGVAVNPHGAEGEAVGGVGAGAAAPAEPVAGEAAGELTPKGGVGAQRVGAEELNLTPVEAARLKELDAQAQTASEQALRASFLHQLIGDPKALGMSKDEFARYSESLAKVQSGVVNKMQERALKAVLRERAPEFKEAAAKHAEDARQAMEALPAVQAQRALSQPGFRLDRDLVQNFYPGNAARVNPNTLRNNGNHPDNAAEQLGYGSGAELVQALADLHEAQTAAGAKDLNGYVKLQSRLAGEMNARRQFGYDLTPGTAYDAASELVHAPEVSRFLADELRHLSPGFNEYDVDNYVRERFQTLTVRLASNTRKLTELAYKAGVKAQRALQKGDAPKAIQHRQAQYIQHELARRSMDFAKELRKGLRTFKRVADNVSIPGIAQVQLNWAKDVLATTGLPVRGNPVDLRRPIGGYATLDEFIAGKNGAGGQIIRAPVPVGTDVPAMSVRQFQGLSDMVESILTNGRNEGKVTVDGEKRELAETVAEALPRFERYTRTITEEERNSPTFMQSIDAARRGVDAWLVRLPQLIKDLSGGDPTNPFFRVAYDPLKQGEAADRDMRTWVGKHFRELNKDVGKGWNAWLKMRLPLDGPHKFVATTREGDPVFNTGMDVAIAALHMGDEEALSRFAEGYNATPQDIENVVHQFATPQMWKFVRGMWDVFEHFRPEIEALYRRQTGVTPKMVEPRPFTTRFGDNMKGAYFPVLYDTVANPTDFVKAMDPEELLGERHYVRATPSNGYIKERTRQAGMVQRQLGTVYSRINQVIHDLAYREALEQANKFLSHPDIQSAIKRKYGPEYVEKIRNNLQRIAGAESTDTNNNLAARAAADWVTEGQMVNMIGFSPKTLMKHMLTVIPQAVAEVGPRRYAQAYGDFLSHHDERMAQAIVESPALRHMVANYGEDSYRQFLELTEKTGLTAQVRSYAFHMISNVQRHVGAALYFAAKQRLADQFPGMSEAGLRQGANHVVEQTTGSAGLVDSPEALVADTHTVPGAFYRMGNNFLTFLSHMYNRSREIPQNLGYAGDKVDQGRAFGLLMTMLVLPILIDQEIDEHFDKAIWDLGMWGEGFIHQITSPVPGANAAVAAGMHRVDAHYFAPGSPTEDIGTDVGAVGADIKHLFQGKALDNRAVQHALVAGGQVMKLPGASAAKVEGFIYDLSQGKKTLNQLAEELLLGNPPKTAHHAAPPAGAFAP